MPKIHCGNCDKSNKPYCYSDCEIKRKNDDERKSRQDACNPYSFMADYYKGLGKRLDRIYCQTGRTSIVH